MKRLLPLVGVAMLVFSACAQAGSTPSGPARVTVTMSEWSVKLSQVSVLAGQVTFVLKNDGKITHELAILQTDLAQDKIPVRANDAKKVQEPGMVGEIEGVGPGITKEATFDLKPGNYVLICNEEEHYKAGMYLAFAVK